MDDTLKKTTLLTILLMSAFTAPRPAAAADSPKTPPGLRETLEKVYSDYLAAVEREDAKLLLSVLPSARSADLKKTFEMNGLKFPDDYFITMRRYAPKMPPTGKFQFVATTDSAIYANLIYVGNMNGYLRKNTDETRFLIIQFEKDNDGWKYAVVIDPPASLVPDLEKKLAAGKLDFIATRPFVPEKIQLLP